MSSSGVNLESYLIPLEEIKRATKNFSQKRCIGGGGFGAVYKGQLSQGWQNRTAAIKRLDRESHQGQREFHNELVMISRFHHDNIISFMGYCDEDNEMIIVYEYAIDGSLDQHLQDPNKMRCITWTQRLEICIGAARGLNYLHSGLGEHNRVIHRDVKSANILLDENFVAKISDFGLSKSGPRNQPDTELHTKVAGTQFYLDPTYQESRILRKESDVYSFGVVMFEILSGMLVFCERSIGNNEPQILMNSVRRYHQKEPETVIDPHIRDQVDSRCFDIFQEVAYQCISLNLMERPSLDTVIKRIEEALTFQTSRRSTSTSLEPSLIESLIPKLTSTSPYDQRKAAHEICLFAQENKENCFALTQAGVIPMLTELLSSPDIRTQYYVVATLLNLTSLENNNNNIMLSSRVLTGIIHVMKEGSIEALENAAYLLMRLSLNVDERVSMSIDSEIAPIVLLLSEGTIRVKKFAAMALGILYFVSGMKETSVRAGVVPKLMELLKEPQGEMEDEALSLLKELSSCPEGSLAICNADVVPIMVELIGSGSPEKKQKAAQVLVEVCSCGSQKHLVEAQELGVTEKLLDLLHHGTDEGKTAAQQLLEKIQMLPAYARLPVIRSIFSWFS